MENFDIEYYILKEEIKNLPNVKNVDSLKEELYRYLNKIINSTDNNYKKESIRSMFITIDLIKRLPIKTNYLDGYVLTEIISKDNFTNNPYFTMNSLIARITIDSFDDIKYINEKKYISKAVNDMFRNICVNMKFQEEDKLKKLRETFSNRIKLVKLREYIEKTEKSNKKADKLYDNLIEDYYYKMGKDLEEILSVSNNLNEYEKDLLVAFKCNIRKLKDVEDKSYKLEKLIEYYEELNDLFNHIFDRKRKVDYDNIKEANDEITIVVVSDLKEIKRAVPKKLEKNYEALVNELRRINLRTTTVEKFFKLNSLRQKINSLKIMSLDKAVNIDEENLYNYIYNFYFRKIDEDLEQYLVDNIYNSEIINKYLSFKESIKKEETKDVNSLIDQIILLQNMKERIELDDNKLIKA